MQLSDLTPENLRRLLPLVERHAKLTAELAALEKDISSAVSGGQPSKETKPPKVKSSKKATKSASQERSPRGTLKTSILTVLSAAGPEGISVSEIADKVKVPPGNIHAWFSTTGKKVMGLKKVSRGHWGYTDISNGGWV